MQTLKVSVCVITYNQQDYIEQCLDKIINQKTDFEYEIVVGEDCSTDQTATIVSQMAKSNLNLRVLDNSRNLSVLPNFIRTLRECNGEYIAFCEGDDYWVDEYKLQKQVDFLQQNPQYGGVCGEIISRDVESNIEEKQSFKKEGAIVFEEVIIKNKIHSNTILFRRELLNIDDLDTIKNLSIGDWYLHLLITKQKPYYYLPEHFALYRIHNNGIFSKRTEFFKSYQKSRLLHAFLMDQGNQQNFKMIEKSLKNQILSALRASSSDDKKEIKELFSIIIKQKILKVNRSSIHGALNLIK